MYNRHWCKNAVIAVKQGKPIDSECHTLPPTESKTLSKTIQLTNGFGQMNRHKREAVTRFINITKPLSLAIAKLMLYYPWHNEHVDLLGGYATYEKHHQHV